MPELQPIWNDLIDLSGNSEEAARMLGLYCPTPYLSGCSQAVWMRDEPVLFRNYDYNPVACEGTFVHTNWSGTKVMAASDCLWGVLDGVNEHGLCLALSFGGRRVVGEGFGIPLILRYVLETCGTMTEAIAVLQRVPSHMAYNVSLLDKAGERSVVQVGPDRETLVQQRDVATNHQGSVEWMSYERFSQSVKREKFLTEKLADESLDAEAFRELFLHAPLHKRNYNRAFGTIYTVSYAPASGTAVHTWPGARIEQSLVKFVEQDLVVTFESLRR
jgi:predicted choloylglycine hydrolase